MYTMNYNARTLFTPLVDEYALEKPMLNQEANRLSSISFTIYPVHPEYGRIEPLKGELALYLDGNRIGRYRPVGYKKAMRGGIAWQFEEMAAALNDIKRRPTSFHGSPEALLTSAIAYYNARRTSGSLVFAAGNVRGVDAEELDFINEEYVGIWDFLISSLPGKYGGFLIPRYAGNTIYIDFLQEEYLPEAGQTIEFGVNLADKFIDTSGANAFSTLIPLGASLSPDDDIDDETYGDDVVVIDDGDRIRKYVTIKKVNGGRDYIENSAGITEYGERRELVAIWPDIEEPAALLEKAREYLSENAVKLANSVSLDAVDLRNTGADVEAFRFMTRVLAQSEPLGVSVRYVVAKINVPLGAPNNTKIKVGTLKGSMSGAMNGKADAVTVERVVRRIEKGEYLVSKTNERLQLVFKKTGIKSLEGDQTLWSQITMNAEAIETEVGRATDAETGMLTSISRIKQTADSVSAEVVAARDGKETLSARLTIMSDSITSEVRRASEAESSLSTRILQTAESLTAEVNRATEAEGSLSSRITATAESITAEVNRATEAEGSLSSRISVTAESITAEVARANAAEGSLSSRITQTAESISAEVSRASEAEGSLSSRITMTAESITAEVARATNAEGSLSSRITMTAESITAEVTRANDAEGSLSSRIAQTAESITAEVNRATNAEGSLSSRITMTAESITSEVTRATNAEGSLSSRITQTAESITAEVNRASEAEGSLSSRITVTANSITSVVSKTGINSLGQGETLYSRIEQNAESITTKVSAGDIASTINQTAQSVTINASKIDLSGYVTANEFDATKAKIDNLTGATIVENFCRAGLVVGTTVTANNTFTHAGDTIYKRPLRWVTNGTIIATVHAVGTDASSIILSHSHAMTVSSTGVVTVGAPQAANGTFNIADTAFYLSAVSAARTDGWDLAYGKNVVPAANTTATMTVKYPGSNYNTQSTYNYTVSADVDYVYIQNAVGTTVARAANTPAITAWSSGNNSGYQSASGVVSLPSTMASGYKANTTLKYPTYSTSAGGGTGEQNYYLTYTAYADGTIDAFVRAGSSTSSNYILRAEIDAVSRWTAAVGKVVWPVIGVASGTSASPGPAIPFKYPGTAYNTQDTKNYYLRQHAGGFSNNRIDVFLLESPNAGEYIARHTVDASSVYSAGNTDGQTTGWNNAAAISVLPKRTDADAYFTATIPTSGGGTSQKEYYLDRTYGSWSGGSKTIYVFELDNNRTQVGTVAFGSVSIPDPTNWSISYTAEGATVSFKVGGKSFSHTFKD